MSREDSIGVEEYASAIVYVATTLGVSLLLPQNDFELLRQEIKARFEDEAERFLTISEKIAQGKNAPKEIEKFRKQMQLKELPKRLPKKLNIYRSDLPRTPQVPFAARTQLAQEKVVGHVRGNSVIRGPRRYARK